MSFAAWQGSLAADVDRKAVPVCAEEEGASVPVDGYVERLAAQNGLHVTHVGSVRVVTRAPGRGERGFALEQSPRERTGLEGPSA